MHPRKPCRPGKPTCTLASQKPSAVWKRCHLIPQMSPCVKEAKPSDTAWPRQDRTGVRCAVSWGWAGRHLLFLRWYRALQGIGDNSVLNVSRSVWGPRTAQRGAFPLGREAAPYLDDPMSDWKGEPMVSWGLWPFTDDIALGCAVRPLLVVPALAAWGPMLDFPWGKMTHFSFWD